MKNKKIVISVGVLLIVIIIIIIAIAIFNNKNNSENNTTNQTSESTPSSTPTFTIESTKDNPIEMNGIEASSLQIKNNNGDVEIITTLRNNTQENINGFFIEINLLDKDNNIITTISENSKKTIKAYSNHTMTNYISALDNAEDITNAQIVTLEKNSIQNMLENRFKDIEAIEN